MIRILILILFSLLFAGSRQGAPAAPIVFTEIDLNEPVAAMLFGDTNGDGLKDAILLIDRRVQVHRLNSAGNFSKNADLIIKLPRSAVGIDAGVLDPPGATRALSKAQLIVLATDGVFAHALDREGAEFVPLELPELKDPLAVHAAGAAPIPMPLLAAFGSDSTQKLLIPLGEGIAILQQFAGAGESAPGWRLAGIAPAPVEVALEIGQNRPGSFIKQSYELPRVSLVEIKNKSGASENLLSISRENDAWIYQFKDGGISLIEQARGLFRFDNEDRFREARGTRSNEDTNDRAVGLFATDLTGDGIPDFVSSRFRDGQVFITLGRPGRFSAEAPDRSLDVDGWAVLAQARDFNGDGRPDLIVPRLPKLGISGALKALLSRKVSIDLWVYKNNNTAQIVNNTPDWKYSFDVDILLGGEEGKVSVSARLLTNFFDTNADGLADFVTLAGKDELAVYPGDPKDFIRENPIFKFKIPSIEPWPEIDMRASDWNGDRRDDFVILYGSNKKGAKNKLLFAVWK